MAKLQAVYDSGMAASELAETVADAKVNATTFSLMKASFVVMTTHGHSLTENVCRFWCLQWAEHTLSRFNVPAFVDTCRIWTLGGDVRSEETSDFDVEAPQLWQVSPLRGDEEMLEETPQQKPTLPAAVQEWEANRAFDKSVASFPTLFLNAFGTDALYQLLKTDISKSKVARPIFFAKCRPN